MVNYSSTYTLTHKVYMSFHKRVKRVFILEKYRFGFWSFIYTRVLTKTILVLIVKNIDISSCICSGSYPYTLDFVFGEVLEK